MGTAIKVYAKTLMLLSIAVYYTLYYLVYTYIIIIMHVIVQIYVLCTLYT